VTERYFYAQFATWCHKVAEVCDTKLQYKAFGILNI